MKSNGNKWKVSVDIRDVRYVPSINTGSKIFVDKKRKQKSRKFLNDKRNWE